MDRLRERISSGIPCLGVRPVIWRLLLVAAVVSLAISGWLRFGVGHNRPLFDAAFLVAAVLVVALGVRELTSIVGPRRESDDEPR